MSRESEKKNNKKAVVLFSGGLDSTTVLAYAKSKNFNCFALSFHYGQRHESEMNAAKEIAKHFDVSEHKFFSLPLDSIGGSSLVDSSKAIIKSENLEIPSTYVPARNLIFLSVALGWAESIGANDIFIGVNAVDYSGYPDCRPEFINLFQKISKLATKEGILGNNFNINAPLLNFSKKEIIRLGIELGVDYTMTVSCYKANSQGKACGACDACTLRKKGFTDLGIDDPTMYQ
tara:strand:- start:2777 stop:3472 length:696 start_codon:yes stop_codon:yes gene_type:complete